MVEALIGLSVIVIGLLGIFTLTSTSLSVNRIDADRYVAINLANEGVELVKNLLDRNIIDDNPWNTLPGFTIDGDYKIDYTQSSLFPWDGSNDFLYFNIDGGGYRYKQIEDDKITTFNRKINITNIDDSHIKVISTVYWKSKTESYDFSVVDYFYDLKEFKWNLLH